MTDIDLVERLAEFRSNPESERWDAIAFDAKAEIESLRAENKLLREEVTAGVKILEALHAANDAWGRERALVGELRAELETYSRDVMWVCFGCGHEFAESEYEAAAEHFGMAGEKPAPACVAERDRLREALEKIANGRWNRGEENRSRSALAFARAALTGGNDD